MRKAEREVGAAGAEEGLLAGEAGDIEEALHPADETGEDRGGEEGDEHVFGEGFGEIKGWEEENDDENSDKKSPDDAGGEEGAEGVGRPEDGEGGVEGEERSEPEQLYLGARSPSRLYGRLALKSQALAFLYAPQ